MQIVLFPIRGLCGGALRTLVRAAKERNICLNIGIGLENVEIETMIMMIIFSIGNQRPVKTETNKRTATDDFTLVDGNVQVSYIFGISINELMMIN